MAIAGKLQQSSLIELFTYHSGMDEVEKYTNNVEKESEQFLPVIGSYIVCPIFTLTEVCSN